MLTAHTASLDPDPSRVVSRFFLPGEGTVTTHSRMTQIVDRVLAVPDERLDSLAEAITADLSTRQHDAESLLIGNARAAADRLVAGGHLTTAQLLVLGSAFTAQFAVEGAALCNPSAVEHPFQGGLRDGELRVAVSLRCIGEGHVSSIGFAEAVIGADDTWTFGRRSAPLSRADISGGEWSRTHFEQAMDSAGQLDDFASAVILALPERFRTSDLESTIATLPSELVMRPSSRAPLQALREMADSAYRATFPPDVDLSARVLMPVLAGGASGGRGREVHPLDRQRRHHSVSRHVHRLQRPRHRTPPADINRSQLIRVASTHRRRSAQQRNGAVPSTSRRTPSRPESRRWREHLALELG